ncbi:aminotransferase class I/II-fold pyridoxal phosphate-dependent enzyme [Saccharibacillus sacchari]|uniref:aminotransferase class I/II-fold pyridoxal phosphate-dependent enzyme n=1 Tax=Saccharibacillus sacchari TaxID=456493 RepID=UPI0004AD7126|nr:aminotransferase class I/II-fold pyridoxal phosphate-dependent enzyme [Saccharibacillus sacchari]
MKDLNHKDAPLYAELLRYAARQEASFHVPGHKDGNFYRDIEGKAPYGFAEVLSIDATEIEGTDDLHDPEGVIREAQEKAAAFFGAEETFFLVGGSTVGNLALILTVCSEPGDILIVQRNVHKSVLNGLMLAGARAVFVSPEHELLSGLAMLPGTALLEQALERYPEAKGVLLTRPNYYGMGRSIRETSGLCHRYEVPLLVDEAHGAHYGLHSAFPASALAEGADGVVQSTHKMLGAMTMGAMLHVQGERLDRDLLRKRLAMVQSSSPSYPIMASLDLARSAAEQRGEEGWNDALEAAAYIRTELEQLPRFSYVRPIRSDQDNSRTISSNMDSRYSEQDPFKISVEDVEERLSGYELQQRIADAGCVAEMSDERRTVLALGPGTGMDDAVRLIAALRELQEEAEEKKTDIALEQQIREQSPFEQNADFASASSIARDMPPAISEPVGFDLRQSAAHETVPTETAAGRIAAEMIVPYPPGIPLVYAGERMTESAVAHLIRLRDTGARFQGASDASLKTLRVQTSSPQRQAKNEMIESRQKKDRRR